MDVFICVLIFWRIATLLQKSVLQLKKTNTLYIFLHDPSFCGNNNVFAGTPQTHFVVLDLKLTLLLNQETQT